MANNLFNKIMGKVPVSKVEDSVSEEIKEEIKEEVKEEVKEFVEENTVEKEVVEEKNEEEAVEKVDFSEENEKPEVTYEAADHVTGKTKEVAAEEKSEKEYKASDDVQSLLDSLLGPISLTKVYESDVTQKENHAEAETIEEEKKTAVEQADASKVILIDLVLDTTISMAVIYKRLYDKLFTLVNGIYKEAKKAGGDVEVRYIYQSQRRFL